MQLNDYEKAHLEILRGYAPECTVLLRSSGSFPLKATGKLALYGSGARHTIMGGTGSGEVNTRYFVAIEDGLEQAGFTLTTKTWLDGYDRVHENAHHMFIQDIRDRAKKHHTMPAIEGMGAVMPEPEYDLPLDGEGDTAVYVLSRISGEGSDRAVLPGDILLSEAEKRDILALNKRYKRFLLVLNVGGPVDLSPLDEVKDILLLSQLGIDTGHILADILTGKAYPSGKLTTTWSRWEDYCDVGTFGQPDDTRYREGIYVGYRYFDSVGKRAMFPFGFGLGYTSFTVTAGAVSVDGETVSVAAGVKNTGTMPGREVVQLYLSVPGKRLHSPYQSLAAWCKTKELQPGEFEEVTLSCALPDLASYDEERELYFLERGDYLLRLGTNSTDTEICGMLCLSEDVITRQVKNKCGRLGMIDWRPEAQVPLPADR